MRCLRALILAVTLTLAATACTPAQVTAFFDARGQSIDRPTARFVALALDRWAGRRANGPGPGRPASGAAASG